MKIAITGKMCSGKTTLSNDPYPCLASPMTRLRLAALEPSLEPLPD